MLTLPEFKARLFDSYKRKTHRYPVDRDSKRDCVSYKYSLYPIKQLPALAENLKKLDLSDSFVERYSPRYVVTPQYQALFAPEGKPCYDVPAHRNMANTCLAAGNIGFSEDYRFITYINHQSGDFLSSQGSLVWILAALVWGNVPLTEKFTIHVSQLNENKEFVTAAFFILSPSDLEDLLPKELKNEVIVANHSDEIIVKTNVKRTADTLMQSSKRRSLDRRESPVPSLGSLGLFQPISAAEFRYNTPEKQRPLSPGSL